MWHDPATNTLTYRVPDVQRVLSAIPTARHLYDDLVAIPIGLYNLQVMAWLGFPVIPPMTTNYDWPRDRNIPAPFKAQILTANFLALHPRALTLSDMGTGKTLALLWAADFVMRQHPPGTCRFVINTPLSTMQRVWGDAIFKHLMGRRTYAILHGDHDKRRRMLAEPHDFYIINPDGIKTGVTVKRTKQRRRELELRGLAEDFSKRTDIKGVIFDEISGYRDATTDRHIIARWFVQDKTYLWGATGTPTPNNPTDAYGIAKLINNAFGESHKSFQGRTMYRISNFKWVPMRGAAAEARKLLSPSIRFALEDCMDVPESTTQLRDVPLSDEQKKAYATLRRDAHLVLQEGAAVTPANEAALRLKLIQIVCGAVYYKDGDTRKAYRLDCKPRIEETKRIIAEAGHKVIIFAPLTSVVSMLYEELTDWTREMVNGTVTAKKRNDIFHRFQTQSDPQLIIADPGTMSHGLDLFAAKTTVWYGPTDRTETYLQANRRMRRPGQNTTTAIVQLASTPIEREIFHRIETNQSLQGVTLSLIKGSDNVYR